MPLEPTVTTTTLSRTCIAKPVCLRSSQNQMEDGRGMPGRAQHSQRMPYIVLEAKPLPGMKDDAETIEKAASDNEPERELRQRRQAGIVGDDPAPAHGEIETDRYPVEASREKQL